jgi:Putative Ig domain
VLLDKEHSFFTDVIFMGFRSIFVVVLFSFLVACGGGGSNDQSQKFSTSFDYSQDATNWPIYSAFPSHSPVPSVIGGGTFTITSGSLAPGLSLNSSTGVIYGVPTTPGRYSATITLTILGYTGSGSAVTNLTVNDINLPAQALSFKAGSTFLLSTGQLTEIGGSTMSVSTDSTNGVSVAYSMAPGSTLPASLILDPRTGDISNVASVAAGTYPNVQFQANLTYKGVNHVYTSPTQSMVVTP